MVGGEPRACALLGHTGEEGGGTRGGGDGEAEASEVLANSCEQALGATNTCHRQGGILSEGEEGAGRWELMAASWRHVAVCRLPISVRRIAIAGKVGGSGGEGG